LGAGLVTGGTGWISSATGGVSIADDMLYPVLARPECEAGGGPGSLPVYLAEYILTTFITGRLPESINAPSRVAVAVTYPVAPCSK
jgi:hypothetical protein